jgi:hypothetical protein
MEGTYLVGPIDRLTGVNPRVETINMERSSKIAGMGDVVIAMVQSISPTC